MWNYVCMVSDKGGARQAALSFHIVPTQRFLFSAFYEANILMYDVTKCAAPHSIKNIRHYSALLLFMYSQEIECIELFESRRGT